MRVFDIKRALLCAALLLSVTALVPQQEALAQDASAIYDEAARRASRGSFSRAVEGFQRVLEIDPTWADAAYNAATLSERLNRPQSCALYYQAYLSIAVDPDDEAEVRREMTRCQERVPDGGTLTITSVTPAEASVRVNGVPINPAVAGPITLAPGMHRVEASMIDHAPYFREIEIDRPGARVTLNVTLEEITYYGGLQVSVDQEGAIVRLDGREVGTTPLDEETIELSEGRYLLTVDKDGFHTWQRYMTIRRDNVVPVEIRMLPSSYYVGPMPEAP